MVVVNFNFDDVQHKLTCETCGRTIILGSNDMMPAPWRILVRYMDDGSPDLVVGPSYTWLHTGTAWSKFCSKKCLTRYLNVNPA